MRRLATANFGRKMGAVMHDIYRGRRNDRDACESRQAQHHRLMIGDPLRQMFARSGQLRCVTDLVSRKTLEYAKHPLDYPG
jgi:hypothetical protein